MKSAILTKAGNTLPTDIIQDYIPDWANQFYQAKKAEGVSPYTLRFYKQQLGHFLRYSESQLITRLDQLTPGIIRQFLQAHQESGHNPGGCHAAFRVVRTFLIFYENEVDDWRNPIYKVKSPQLPKKILDPANIPDVLLMTKGCNKDTFLDFRDKSLLLFLTDTGSRARELLGVNVRDVNLISGEVRIIEGKGSKDRVVFLGRMSRKALRRYLSFRTDDNPALFVSEDGERFGYSGLRKVVIKRANQAGVKPPPIHSLRRAFAITMLRNGVDIFSLQKLMGHASLKVLEQYLKQTTEDLQAAHTRYGPVDNSG